MEKVDYKHGNFVIATTKEDKYEYSEYKEWCEVNDIEPAEEESLAFYNWCSYMTREEFNTDMANIESCKEYQVPVLIQGTLGRWDGKHKIRPMRAESVHMAVRMCISNDTQDCEVKYDDGTIVVYSSHHDGTNKFLINALSKKGVAKKSDSFKDHDLKRLPYLYAIGL